MSTSKTGNISEQSYRSTKGRFQNTNTQNIHSFLYRATAHIYVLLDVSPNQSRSELVTTRSIYLEAFEGYLHTDLCRKTNVRTLEHATQQLCIINRTGVVQFNR